MPASAPIGLFDSGIGGLTVGRAIRERLPREALLYFGDSANAPYGLRPTAEILALSKAATEWLLAHGAKLIVVACNTATAAALETLRADYPEVPFVGMEPAVKPAAAATRSGRIGILATQTTLGSDRYHRLAERFAPTSLVLEDPCPGLVPRIESGAWDAPATEHLLRQIIEPMLAAGIDTLVLGCTHYPLVRPLIERIAGPDVKIIDPAPAVARQTERLLAERNLLLPPPQAAAGPDVFYSTGTTQTMERVLQVLGFAPLGSEGKRSSDYKRML
jgi:glutamate racemase